MKYEIEFTASDAKRLKNRMRYLLNAEKDSVPAATYNADLKLFDKLNFKKITTKTKSND